MNVLLLTSKDSLYRMHSIAAQAAKITRGISDFEVNYEKEKELLQKIIKLGHESILEHINLTYRVENLSRACLQELARHRHISLSVESTRYTLRKVMGPVADVIYNASQAFMLKSFRELARAEPELSDDELKYYIPEFWPTNLVLTCNIRELRHIVKLRTSPNALKEFQDLAHKLVDVIPEKFSYLVSDCLYQEVKNS